MKTGQYVASQQLKNLQTAAGSVSTTSTSTSREGRTKTQHSQADVYDAVNYAFTLMRDAFPQHFLKAFPDEESRTRARNLWSQSMIDVHPVKIKRAAGKLIRESKFLPTLSALRSLATSSTYNDLGLRAPQQAYYEACRATNRTHTGPWSHIVVYLAARETGWMLLESEPQTVAYPVFERNYEILCNRLMAGEKLDADISKGLENHTSRDALRRSNVAAEQRLRQEMVEHGIDPDGGRKEFLRTMADLKHS